MAKTDTLSPFLSYAVGQKETALLIVKDERELPEVEAALQGAGFVKADKPLVLLKSIYQKEKTYIVLDENNAKEVFDICVQYPTGQITFLNRSKMVSLFVTPDYANGGVVILVNQSTLEAVEKKGFDFRSITGLTEQA